MKQPLTVRTEHHMVLRHKTRINSMNSRQKDLKCTNSIWTRLFWTESLLRQKPISFLKKWICEWKTATEQEPVFVMEPEQDKILKEETAQEWVWVWVAEPVMALELDSETEHAVIRI